MKHFVNLNLTKKLQMHFVEEVKVSVLGINRDVYTLRERCPYLEFFWYVFSPNAEKNGRAKLRKRTLFT